MRAKVRNEKVRRHERRKRGERKKLVRSSRPVLTIYRSARHIYAQLVDPVTGRTVGGVSTRTPGILEAGVHGGNLAAAEKVGEAVARVAREKQIERVVFNRNGFLYHGRVKALADAARKAGLDF